MTVCSITRSKVKVTSSLKSVIRPFLKAISSPIYIHVLASNNFVLMVPLRIYSLTHSYFLCHVTLKLTVSRSRPPVPYGANLLFNHIRQMAPLVGLRSGGLTFDFAEHLVSLGLLL